MRWPWPCFLNNLVPDDTIGRMGQKPSGALVVLCACLAVLFMAAGVYLGGTGRIPLAMVAVTLFVLLGGLSFELARRRSL